jgi:hypothetical protein
MKKIFGVDIVEIKDEAVVKSNVPITVLTAQGT